MVYLSQTNGPGYCRLVGSLGRATRPFPTNQWVPDYGGDYSFDGDFPFGKNPVFISEPFMITDMLGLGPFTGSHSAEPDLFKFEKPQRGVWSGELDWDRYGTSLDVVNQIQHLGQNLDSPRENEVSHRSFSGDISDVDIPLFDFHTGSEQGLWFAFVPKFDVLDVTNYREFQAFDINADGFLTFNQRDQILDPPGVNAFPTTDYWTHVHKVCDQIAVKGWLAGIYGVGDWDSEELQPDFSWKFVVRNVINNSVKRANWWHIDISYEYEIKRTEGSDWWKTTFLVHQNFYAGFYPSYGSNNPFDWNSIQDDVFRVTDLSTCSVKDCNIFFDGHSYSRYPTDEVTPSVIINTSVPPFVPTYKVRPYSYPLQSSVGTRSRFWEFRIHGYPNRDPDNYVRLIGKQLATVERDFRASSFYSSSDALHKYIDVIKANHIENITQLSGILELLPDLSGLSRLVAKAAKRDPGAILDAVDFLADAVLAYRFAQKPTTDDALELARTDIKKELTGLLLASANTIYGEFHYQPTEAEMSHILKLPGTLKLVTRSKIRIQTDMTTLLSTYLTANSMGIMPTLSRLWAIVPFSFVVDWFTGMGDRLQKVDDQLLWMAMGTNWCLHSFKWTYYPPPEELSSYGLSSSVEKPFGLTGYSREFSRLMPRLTDARFDYLAPSHGPNPVTVGALVWQFL